MRGVERCIASGVYSPPTAKTLPPTAVAAIQKHDGIVFVDLPGAAMIEAVRQTLRAVVEAGPECDHRRISWIG